MFKFSKDNIVKWAQKYDECYDSDERQTEEQIKKLLKRQRYLTQKNLWNMMDWKSARIRHYAVKNAPSLIKRITRYSFKAEKERSCVESLLGQKGGLRGVGYPVASTILHFAFPDKYPIMDFRVIRALNLEQPSSYKFNFWENYCKIIRGLSKKYGLSIRVVEKALWKFDKERNSRKNSCQ